MEAQKIDSREIIDIENSIDRNLDLARGLTVLLLNQDKDHIIDTRLYSVFWRLEESLEQIREDANEIGKRRREQSEQDRQKKEAEDEERRKNRPVSDMEIEAARGFVHVLEEKQKLQKEKQQNDENN